MNFRLLQVPQLFENFKKDFKFSRPVYQLSLRELRVKKSTWGLFLLMFFPWLIEMIIFVYAVLPTNSLINVSNAPNLTNGGFWRTYYRIHLDTVLPYFVTMATLLIGTSMYQDEIKDETISYIMTKPIKRSYIFLQKFLAYFKVITLITIPAVVIQYLTAFLFTARYDSAFNYSRPLIDLPTLLYINIFDLFLVVISVIVITSTLGAIFIFTGLMVNRPLLLNLFLGFSILIEQILIDLIDNRIEPLYLGINILARQVLGFETVFPNFFLRREIPYFDQFSSYVSWIIVLALTIFIGFTQSSKKEFT